MGQSPAAAVLLAQLVSADVLARYAGQAWTQFPPVRTLTSATLDACSGTGLDAQQVSVAVHRTLTENSCTDAPIDAPRQFIVRPAPAAAHGLPASVDSQFVVETALSPDVLPTLVPTDVAVELELIWSVGDDAPPALISLSGEHLDELSARASVVTGFGSTSLLILVPMETLVAQSIAIVDIAWRLIDHQWVAELIPNCQPDHARTHLRRTRPLAAPDRYSSSKLVLESDPVAANPAAVDRSIGSARAAAQVIADASSGNRWTAAHFSRVARLGG